MTSVGCFLLTVLSFRGVLAFVQDYKFFSGKSLKDKTVWKEWISSFKKKN